MLKEIDWDSLILSHSAVDVAYQIFEKEIKRCFGYAFPLVRVSRRAVKDKLWVTKGIKISSARKNRLYRAWLKHKTPNNEAKYKTYRNYFKKVTKAAIASYYREFFQTNAGNAKKLWSQINSLCSYNMLKCRRQSSVTQLNIGGDVINDPSRIANSMNEYFCNIGQGLASKLSSPKHNYQNYMGNSLMNSIYYEEINREEILNLMIDLNPRKSPGSDQISPLLVKENNI